MLLHVAYCVNQHRHQVVSDLGADLLRVVKVLLDFVADGARCQVIQLPCLFLLELLPRGVPSQGARLVNDLLVDEVFHRFRQDVFVLLADEPPAVAQLTDQVLNQGHGHALAPCRRRADLLEHLKGDLEVVGREEVRLGPPEGAVVLPLVNHCVHDSH